MKELKEKLETLKKSGYDTVTIDQILQWMSDIKKEAFIKRNHLDD